MTRRTGGGREARVKERSTSHITAPAFIRRKVMPYDLLTPDGLDLIESKADQLMAEVGIDIKEDADRDLFRQAGASVEDIDRLRSAGALAAEAAGAVEDANGSVEYKEQLVRVLVERCVRDALS